MTTNETKNNAFTEDNFDERVQDAFANVELSAEAEERMLKHVLDYEAAQAQGADTANVSSNTAGTATATTATTDPTAADATAAATSIASAAAPAAAATPDDNDTKSVEGNTALTPKRRLAPWKIALPAAACLLLVLGVGALITNNSLSPEAPTTATSTSAINTAPTTESIANGKTGTMDAMMATEAYESDMAFAPYDPSFYNTEEYNAINEPGFIATATRPLSTFAADVDTASYANLRRLINEGYGLADVYDDAPVTADIEDIEDAEYYAYEYPYEMGAIPKGAIRIEEMLNYFTYNYALPQGDDLFGTTVQLADCPWNADTKLLVMGFATNPETGTATAGRNLVFLIDTSGSMDEPNKMNLLQDAFAELTDQLEPNDRISIVTYSGYEEVVLDGASGSDARTIQRAIDKLRPEGSTNGEAGLKMAYELAQKHFVEGGVNRIILASDGDLNVGMSSESDLHDYVESMRDTGIYLSVLGFGSGNYKDNKMETLADAGNGNYHYIDCLEEAEKVFGSDLVANLVPLANDVKLQVEFNPAKVKGYRLIGYENRALADEDFRDDTKDAGDVGPGHQLTVAYEIVPIDSNMDIAQADLKYSENNGEVSTSNEWLTCTMRYTPVQQSEGEGFVVEASEPREQSIVVDDANLTATPSDDWRFAASIIEFGMVMRDSEYKGTTTLASVDELLDGCDLSSAERKDFQRLVRKAG